ncbi:MAG: tyrosine-type recombinase/integrase [bacterium]|nr:tyrosine-type recombinase/integrase [bacterium]
MNIENVDLTCGLPWIREKGRRHRSMVLPHCICKSIRDKIGLMRIRGKNKNQRALFVVERLFDELTRYLAHPQSPKKKYAALFPAQPDTAISNNRLQNIVKEHARKAGIKSKVTPRVLRHAFATEMYHQNVSLNAIQDMMGHDSIAE